MSTVDNPVPSTKRCLPRIHRVRLRFAIGSLVSLGLASVLLWGLVSEHEPEAELTTFRFTKSPSHNSSSIYLELELTNRNNFRGFNYTDGWAEVFYISGSDNPELNFGFIPLDYQGFKKSLKWNFTLYVYPEDFNWPVKSPLLQSGDGHLYFSLYMAYSYKILLWTTRTTYYQWLNANVSLNSNFDLAAVTNLTPTIDFTVAISS